MWPVPLLSEARPTTQPVTQLTIEDQGTLFPSITNLIKESMRLQIPI